MARQIMAVELHDPGEPRHRKDHAKRKEREDGGEQANHERCISFRWRAGEHSRLRPRKFAGNSKTLTASTGASAQPPLRSRDRPLPSAGAASRVRRTTPSLVSV